MAAVAGFKKGYVTSIPDAIDSDFGDFSGRRLRYRIYWSYYSQSAYDNVNVWATSYRSQYGLYRYIRNVYSPSYRLAEFYKSHLWGGPLDAGAGMDGAVPIETENERVRKALSELWLWSNWQSKKDVVTLWGTVMGDVFVEVVDDVSRGRVYLEPMRPGQVKSVDLDSYGNVKGYELEYEIHHPSRTGTAIYNELVTRDGEDVVYRTYLNGAPHAFSSNLDRSGEPVQEWAIPYGFVPLVFIKHNDVGLDWGWSEYQPLAGKMREADDLASALSDQIRKTIDPIWLMKNIKSTSLSWSGADPTVNRPLPGREEHKLLYAQGENVDAKAMVAELDIQGSLSHLGGIIEEIERDYPELGLQVKTASGDASGRALRVARQPATAKVLQRRANYDSGLVRVQSMAMAMGGYRGYVGYEGLGLDSYGRGDLNHSIADRPVFENDRLDDLEVTAEFWKAAKDATDAGISLEAFLSDNGWDQERIARATAGAS